MQCTNVLFRSSRWKRPPTHSRWQCLMTCSTGLMPRSEWFRLLIKCLAKSVKFSWKDPDNLLVWRWVKGLEFRNEHKWTPWLKLDHLHVKCSQKLAKSCMHSSDVVLFVWSLDLTNFTTVLWICESGFACGGTNEAVEMNVQRSSNISHISMW